MDISVLTVAKIGRIIKEKNINQKTLAQKLNMSESNLSRLLTHKVKLDLKMLEQIAIELEEPLENLITQNSNVINNYFNNGYTLQFGPLEQLTLHVNKEIYKELKSIIDSKKK